MSAGTLADRRDPRPPASHAFDPTRWSDLSRRDWWLLASVTAAVLVPVVAGIIHARAIGWVPLGDEASIAAQSRDVFSSRFPMLGMPTTLVGSEGAVSNHPGPLLFWVLAVPVRILGPAWGIVIGASLINVVAIVGTAWVMVRSATPKIAAAAVIAIGIVALNHGGATGTALASNSVVVLLLAGLAAFTAFGLASGDRWLLPLLVFLASLILQAELAYGPMVLALSAWGLVSWWRTTADGPRPEPRRSAPGSRTVALQAGFAALLGLAVLVVIGDTWWLLGSVAVVGAVAAVVAWLWRTGRWRDRVLRWTLVVLVLCWIVPTLEAVVNEGGNIAHLWDGLTNEARVTQGANYAGAVAAGVLGPVPVFVRGFTAEGFVRDPGVLSLLALIAGAFLWWRAARRGDAQLRRLFFLAALVSVAAAFAASRLPVDEGFLSSHVLWVSVAAVLWWLALLVAASREVRGRFPVIERFERGLLLVGAAVLAVVSVLPTMGVWWAVHGEAEDVYADEFIWVYDAFAGIDDDLDENVEGDGPYLIAAAGGLFPELLTRGFIASLDADGVGTVTADYSGFFGDARNYETHRDEVEGVLTIAPGALPEPLDGERVASWRPDGYDPEAVEALADELVAHAEEGTLVLSTRPGDVAGLELALAGFVPDICRSQYPTSGVSADACQPVEAFAEDPERLLDLPPLAVLGLYRTSLIVGPELTPELRERMLNEFAEVPIDVYLGPPPG